MKCENCGKNEINFHFTANVNGAITERHLCSECAAKLGYAGADMFGRGGVLGGVLDDFFGGAREYSPFGGVFGPGRGIMPFGGFPGVGQSFGMIIPAFPIQGIASGIAQPAYAPEQDAREGAPAGLDDELKKRLEINKLREQMAQAAQSDDFETAARIRDRIKAME
jgi:protein arginine kinase activator